MKSRTFLSLATVLVAVIFVGMTIFYLFAATRGLTLMCVLWIIATADFIRRENRKRAM